MTSRDSIITLVVVSALSIVACTSDIVTHSGPGTDPTPSATPSVRPTMNPLLCGNNSLEIGEECDGTQLGGESCETLDFDSGTLGCTSGCMYSYEHCEVTPTDVQIESVTTGPIVHGQTVTATGSGFGGKSTVAPYKFDTFDSGALNSQVGNGWAPNVHVTYSDAHARYTGSRSARQDYATPGVYNADFGPKVIGRRAYFVSFYRYLDLQYDPNIEFSDNYKVFQISGSDESWSYPQFRSGYDGLTPNHAYIQESGSLAYGGSEVSFGLDPDHWDKFEFLIDIGAPHTSSGYYRIWHNGRLMHARNDLPTNDPAIWSDFGFIHINGYYARRIGYDEETQSDIPCVTGCPALFFIDDAYIDTSAARVEICDVPLRSTKETSGATCALQPPISWGADTIDFRANVAGLSASVPLYLYIVNGGNVANAAGFLIPEGIQPLP